MEPQTNQSGMETAGQCSIELHLHSFTQISLPRTLFLARANKTHVDLGEDSDSSFGSSSSSKKSYSEDDPFFAAQKFPLKIIKIFTRDRKQHFHVLIDGGSSYSVITEAAAKIYLEGDNRRSPFTEIRYPFNLTLCGATHYVTKSLPFRATVGYDSFAHKINTPLCVISSLHREGNVDLDIIFGRNILRSYLFVDEDLYNDVIDTQSRVGEEEEKEEGEEEGEG